MGQAPKVMRFDPRDLIGPPFEDCPKCHKPEFGVLSIAEDSYTRRCRACWHTLRFGLPKLKKKVIYLDQFVFSNIMKILSAEAPGHEAAKAQPLWRELFETIDVLCRMQLIVCPDSTEHHSESLISPFYEELKSTYEHFSTGISFDRPISIQHHQVMVSFSGHLNGTPTVFDLDPRRVTHGRLHGWSDRVFVTVSGTLPHERRSIQTARSNLQASLAGIFREWQKGGQTFGEAFLREKTSYSKGVVDAYLADQKKLMQVMTGQLAPTPENILGSVNGSLIADLEYTAKMHGLPPGKAEQAVRSFVASGAMNEIPSNVVAASMWASLAMQAAAGQKKPPDEGMATDIDVVSALLPYCDAMFVDNKCRALLNEIPKAYKPPYECKVFSAKTSGEFLKYLAEIRANVSLEHLALLHKVYGSKVLDPPKSIYGVGARKRPAD